jgi:hypothetical protein
MITLFHTLLKPCQLIDHSGVVRANTHASNKRLIWDHLSCGLHHLQTRDLFIPLVGRVFSFSNRFWDGFFFLQPFHGRVDLEITGFGMDCNCFCLSIQSFWMWTGKNFVKNQPCISLTFLFSLNNKPFVINMRRQHLNSTTFLYVSQTGNTKEGEQNIVSVGGVLVVFRSRA